MLTLDELARALDGTLVGDGHAKFARVNSDSRSVGAGDLFVALVGEHFDGNNFAEMAIHHGAAAALVTRGRQWPVGHNLVEVDDTLVALGRLGAYWRSRFDLPVVGITGTNGKTSVKEMLAAVLRHQVGEEGVLATAGNLNNQIGLPLMLSRIRSAHRYAVLEMGMNHFGEIRYLTKLAKPQVALVNNAGAGHLEFLGSIEGVARAKGEIYEGLAGDGIVVFNADDDHAGYWRGLAQGRRVLDFGLNDAAVRASKVEVGPLESRFTLHTPQGEALVTLRVPGLHNVRNALAAAAAATALGLGVADIAAGLATYGGTKGRLQQKRAANGALVIDDTYNANPNSMRAAIDVLAAQRAPRILALGDMGEVGAEIATAHHDVCAYARTAGIEHLFTTGEQMQEAVVAFGPNGLWFADHASLAAAVTEKMTATSTVLVKGSRFMRMERVVDALTNPANVAGAEK
ncbi:MAG: UDP-N-acetylmuramoyl-tripeptide--D-alanyl-D-alanine ligase [Burkholderiales bacterium]|nr:UDP-N-acetylmuramoyl-tripeptide--D-alanyl-D-alanine ligase [Burkholderiales bacterium]